MHVAAERLVLARMRGGEDLLRSGSVAEQAAPCRMNCSAQLNVTPSVVNVHGNHCENGDFSVKKNVNSLMV